MTEEEWMITCDTLAMANLVRRRPVRKLRLAAVALCDSVSRHVSECGSVELLRQTELFADGLIKMEELRSFRRPVGTFTNGLLNIVKQSDRSGILNPEVRLYSAASACLEASTASRDMIRYAINSISQSGLDPDNCRQADLLRDIFGNPFRPISFAQVWRTEAAVGIAAKMYDSREFGNMPILADALQDAGCELPEVLDHCRGPGPHVRGCWVVDLVLGKA